MVKSWHGWPCKDWSVISECMCRYMECVPSGDVPAAAVLLGSLAKHLGQRRETSVAGAVPALIRLLQSDSGAVESCRTLRCIIESRPSEQSECMRIIAEGGVSKLVACLASEVSLPCPVPSLQHLPRSYLSPFPVLRGSLHSDQKRAWERHEGQMPLHQPRYC